jgi:hypothetical protein
MARAKMTRTCTPVHLDTEATWPSATRRTRTWWNPPGQSDDGGPPLTELTSESAGALSPFGEDHSFPLPADRIRYAHPTDKPNRAGVQVVEGR